METSTQGSLKDIFFSNISDTAMVIGVVGILMVMIIPLPSYLLDFLLALNITFSIIVILMAMYTVKPLDFAIFPTLLLVTTLFRLSLNIASTRLILLHGNEGALAAGKVIKSFGDFVVGGNYVVGMVVFVILVIINFIVITKGSGRIAEVAARFTLDAMPGKQMSIDADLNAGLIEENEAKSRREVISREAEFHGAMDGASKFVRGDAIAGIVICLVNIIGGFIIGVLQKKMSVGMAAQNYTLLTVGDGGVDFSKQLLSNPKAVYLGSVIIFMFGLIPGLPHLPFMVLGATIGGALYVFQKKTREALAAVSAKEAEAEKAEEAPESVEHLLLLDPMELEVGYAIIPLVDREQDGELLDRIRSMRRQFALEMGMVIPSIHIRDNLNLKPSEYRILIKGVEVGKFELMADHLMAMDPGDATQKIDGIPTKEPAFELSAVWIPEKRQDEAKFAGYTVVDNTAIIATHISEIIRHHAHELLGRQEVQTLLDNLARTHPKVVEELTPALLSLGGIQKVSQNLLREGVSIRDMLTIVEALADYAPVTKDPDMLTEYVRQRLARAIVSSRVPENGVLNVLTLEQDVEDVLLDSVQHTEHGSYLSVDPKVAGSIMNSVNKETEKAMARGFEPIILCSPQLRRHFRRMIERFVPSLMVLSHSELLDSVQFKSLGKVSLENAG
ncbi:MAG: flagellar biosynthesis protein FlhA [Deltaproteobacteria bacterium]|nr:flagellar biosynthesis protein FlhA [Deltaproteobacteria bacterium]